jgi:hypothetical protein
LLHSSARRRDGHECSPTAESYSACFPQVNTGWRRLGAMPDLPLSPYTVLDLTIARAGPTAVRLLADWGANVIKVEAAESAGGRSDVE